MYEALFYGGLGLGTGLIIAAVFFFILFKIPSVHEYFAKYSHKGLAQAPVSSKPLPTPAAKKPETTTKLMPPPGVARPLKAPSPAMPKPPPKAPAAAKQAVATGAVKPAAKPATPPTAGQNIPDEKTELLEAVRILKQIDLLSRELRQDKTDLLDNTAPVEDGPTQLLEWSGTPGQTEILERTEILPDRTELLQVWTGPSGEKTELLDRD